MTVDATTPEPPSMALPPLRVIFVSTGNACRSQMAEAVLRSEGRGRFEVVSGGTKPRAIESEAIRALASAGLDISGAESKSVMRYANQSFDYVITVCDRARTACPVFPGVGELLHWGIDDPAEATGSDAERTAAYDHALTQIAGRIRGFVPHATPHHA